MKVLVGYSIGNGPAHASDQTNRSPSVSINHFFGDSLRRGEYARDVYLEDTVEILGCAL